MSTVILCMDDGVAFRLEKMKVKNNIVKKIVLFPEVDRVKMFLILTRPHSQICIRIYIFN